MQYKMLVENNSWSVKAWFGYEVVRPEMFQYNFLTLYNPGPTYKALMPFMKTPYFLYLFHKKN